MCGRQWCGYGHTHAGPNPTGEARRGEATKARWARRDSASGEREGESPGWAPELAAGAAMARGARGGGGAQAAAGCNRTSARGRGTAGLVGCGCPRAPAGGGAVRGGEAGRTGGKRRGEAHRGGRDSGSGVEEVVGDDMRRGGRPVGRLR